MNLEKYFIFIAVLTACYAIGMSLLVYNYIVTDEDTYIVHNDPVIKLTPASQADLPTYIN